MNATTATEFMTANKGADIEIVLTDGSSVYGTALSVNSKGANVKDDAGKTRSVSLARIDELVLITDDTFGSDDDADDLAAADIDLDDELDTEVDEDEESFMDDAEDEDTTVADRMEEIVNEISDGATTAEIAAHLSDLMGTEITPKELRVHLRALGLGVGKGRKYALSSGEFRAVHALIVAAA